MSRVDVSGEIANVERRHKPVKWDRVLIDVCTQNDYLSPGSILQVANRDELVPNLQQVFSWARHCRLGTFSAMESHRRTEPLAGFPLHCIDDTPGQKKPEFSYLHPSIMIEADNYLSLPPDLHNYNQLIFRKRTRDVLGNPKADRFLTQLPAVEFIIFGVGLEQSIKSLALGLLARHKSVTVISDACGYWSAADADLSLRQLSAKQIKLVTVAELTALPVIPAPTRRRPARRAVRDRLSPHAEGDARPKARTDAAGG